MPEYKIFCVTGEDPESLRMKLQARLEEMAESLWTLHCITPIQNLVEGYDETRQIATTLLVTFERKRTRKDLGL